MKCRNGFVSNSSSSSFCIYGTQLDEDDVDKILLKITGKTKEELEEAGEETDIGEIIYDYKINDKTFQLEYYNMCGCSEFLGRPFSSIQNNETGESFKRTTEMELKELLGQEVKCEHHEEAWQEG